MRILFMGTPDFAVPSLRALADSGEEIVGVVTQPDKPKGRGYVLTPPPTKVLAEAHGIPVYQPVTLKDGAFEEVLRTLAPDLVAVVAYGKILPKYLLDYPRYGCINLHASLLPKYRGAAPMQRAIMAGETETGVTTMYMAEGLDTGDMLLKIGHLTPNHARDDVAHAVVVADLLVLIPRGILTALGRPLAGLVGRRSIVRQ